MSLYFNIAGPCNPSEHYMIDALKRGGKEMLNLIEKKHYYVVHAARQSGKTTLLWELTDKIQAEGKYYALYCSLEGVQEIKEQSEGIPAIVKKIKQELRMQKLPDGFAANADYGDYSNVLKISFVEYCRSLDKPLVIFFDEADCLSNGTLISFLRQLREGFISRARIPFVHSIALVGMRNIRDYKARIRDDTETEALSLRRFNKDEVAELYSQHTAKTGQIFEPQATDFIFEQTAGQPWLVNAIARWCVEKITQDDYSKPVTKEFAEQAIQDIILERGTHFDSLMERLKEPRVRSIVQPLILGEDLNVDRLSDDYLYTRDLGIICDENRTTKAANPIYAELIIRALSWSVQESIKENYEDYTVPRYIKNGKIDMDFLIRDFQEFWRENSEIWIDRYKKNFYQYDEAAPHLVFQAFLQRVINGGGRIIREMALGKKRADLCVVYDAQKYPVELKILRNEKSVSDGLEQISVYMDKMGASDGWLVLFDRTEKSWEEKLYMRSEKHKGKNITVVGV